MVCFDSACGNLILISLYVQYFSLDLNSTYGCYMKVLINHYYYYYYYYLTGILSVSCQQDRICPGRTANCLETLWYNLLWGTQSLCVCQELVWHVVDIQWQSIEQTETSLPRLVWEQSRGGGGLWGGAANFNSFCGMLMWHCRSSINWLSLPG